MNQDPGGPLNVGGSSGGGGGSGGSSVETSAQGHETSSIINTAGYLGSSAVSQMVYPSPVYPSPSDVVDTSTDASSSSVYTLSAVGGGVTSTLSVQPTSTTSWRGRGDHNSEWGPQSQYWGGGGPPGGGGGWLELGPSDVTSSAAASKKTACMAKRKRATKARMEWSDKR